MKLVFWICLSVITLVFLFGQKGVIRLIELKIEKESIKRNINELGKETTMLEQEINDFKINPEAIEREARERLGLVKKGEVIYRFYDPSKTSLTTK